MISGSSRPTLRAAVARWLRSTAGSASSARLAAQYRPALRLPSGWLATHWARWLRSRLWGRAPFRLLLLALGFQEPGDCGPVQAAVAAEPLDELVGLSADLGRWSENVAALGAEVQMVAGQAAIALAGASEVGVYPAGWGPYVGRRAAGQARALEPGEGG